MGHAQIFSQINIFMNIQNRGKFHLYSVYGCQVINFSMFSWRCSIHEMDHFRGFLRPNYPKYHSILLKFAPEVVFNEKKTLFKNFLEIQIFTETAHY